MNDTIHQITYNGDIVAGSLLVRESRIIAGMLLDDGCEADWHRAVVIENVLQKKSPVTAKKQMRLIKNRLLLMKPALWKLVAAGSSDVAAQALLAASIKYSRLIGDFMDTVLRTHWQTFNPKITTKDWHDFLETCTQLDPKVGAWTDSTRMKLKQIVFRILTESGYVENTRSCRLIPAAVFPEIKNYLVENSETYILRCMEITQ